MEVRGTLEVLTDQAELVGLDRVVDVFVGGAGGELGGPQAAQVVADQGGIEGGAQGVEVRPARAGGGGGAQRRQRQELPSRQFQMSSSPLVCWAAAWPSYQAWKASGVSTTTNPRMVEWPMPHSCAQAIS